MVVYSLYIMSKSGGLIFQRDFAKTDKQITGNQYLILAATFHSLHVISKQLTPLRPSAIGPSGAPTAAAAAGSSGGKAGGRSGAKRGGALTTASSSSSSSSSAAAASGGRHGGGGGSGVTRRRLMVHGDSGIQVLEADGFKLHSYAAPTGTKFFLVASSGQQNCDTLLKYVYEMYADYVMKNPFYEVEMPIHCSKFDLKLDSVLQDTTKKDSS